MQVIIYQNDMGGVSVIRPTEEALTLLGLAAIANKDVPAGQPYGVVDAADLPADRTARDAWDVYSAALTDGTGADFGAGSAYDVIGYAADLKPIVRHADFDTGAEHGFEEVNGVYYQWWIDHATGTKKGVPA